VKQTIWSWAAIGLVLLSMASCRRSTADKQPGSDSPATLAGAPLNLDPVLAYMPADFDAIVVIDVQRIVASPAWQSALQTIPTLAKGLEDTPLVGDLAGIDLSNVKAIYEAVRFGKDTVFVITTHQPVPREELIVGMDVIEFREVQVGSRTIYEGESFARFMSPAADSSEPSGPVFDGSGRSYCLVEPNVLVCTSAQDLQAILESGGASQLPAKLQAALAMADATAPIVIAVNFASMAQEADSRRSDPFAQALATNAQLLGGHISLDGDVTARLTLTCRDAQAADELKKLADGGLIMAKNDERAPPQALDIINSIQLVAESNQIKGTASVPVATITGLIASEANLSGEPEYYGQPLSELISELEGGERRVAAIQAIAALGPEAKSAVEPLVALLADADAETKGHVAMALGRIGPDAAAALPSLIAAAGDTDANVRQNVVEALGRIGAQDPGVVPALAAALRDDDYNVVLFAITALRHVGAGAAEAVPALVEVLPENPSAISALAAIGPAAQDAVPALVDVALEGINSDVTREAARALGDISDVAVATVTERLGDSNSDVRARAAEILGVLGPRAASAVPPLAEALQDEIPAVQSSAARALGDIGPAAEAALPQLREALANRVEGAVYGLGGLGPAAAPAVPALLEELNFLTSYDRLAVINALAKIGPEAKDALPVLREMTSDDTVAVDAALAIWRISGDGEEAAGALATLTRTLDSYQKEQAVDALGTMGPDAATAVPALVELLTSDDGGSLTLKQAAAAALGNIGPNAADAVPVLIQLLPERPDEYSEVPEIAAAALGKIAPQSPEVIAALVRVLKRRSYGSTAAAAIALGESGEAARLAVPLLEDLLHDSRPNRMAAAYALWRIDGRTDEPLRIALLTVADPDELSENRLVAIRVLSALGHQAPDAVAALRRASRSDDTSVRQAAAEALDTIDLNQSTN